MSGALGRLVLRAQGRLPVAAPVLASRFEPAEPTPGGPVESWGETNSATAATARAAPPVEDPQAPESRAPTRRTAAAPIPGALQATASAHQAPGRSAPPVIPAIPAPRPHFGNRRTRRHPPPRRRKSGRTVPGQNFPRMTDFGAFRLLPPR